MLDAAVIVNGRDDLDAVVAVMTFVVSVAVSEKAPSGVDDRRPRRRC